MYISYVKTPPDTKIKSILSTQSLKFFAGLDDA